MSTLTAPEIYAFGGFQLDPGRRRLSAADGHPITITSKSFDALVYLVEHARELVERSDLIAVLWPNTVVEENNLNQAISALRHVLGKGYIVTVPGRGYQFVADVEIVSPESSGTASTMAQRPWIALAVIGLLVLAVGIFVVNPNRAFPVPPDQWVQLTDCPSSNKWDR